MRWVLSLFGARAAEGRLVARHSSALCCSVTGPAHDPFGSYTTSRTTTLAIQIGTTRGLSGPRGSLQDSVTGLLLAGIGDIDKDQNKNFLIMDASESTFASLISREQFGLTNRDPNDGHRVDFPGVHGAQGYRYPPHQPACQCPSVSICVCGEDVAYVRLLTGYGLLSTSIRLHSLLSLRSHRRNTHMVCALLRLSLCTTDLVDPAKDSVLKRVQKLRGD